MIQPQNLAQVMIIIYFHLNTIVCSVLTSWRLVSSILDILAEDLFLFSEISGTMLVSITPCVSSSIRCKFNIILFHFVQQVLSLVQGYYYFDDMNWNKLFELHPS